MKEGYLQLKISELNDKCKKIDQMIAMEKSKIQLLEQTVGGSKVLIKKLKDLEEYKKDILKQVQKDNKEIISEEIKNISDKISKNIDTMVKNKIKEIENTLEYMKNQEKESNQQTQTISQINNKLNYLLKHNEILMMKLVNKTVLSDREVTELDKRSSKKSD